MSKESPSPRPWTIKHSFNVMSGERGVATTGGHSDNKRSEQVHAENIANAELICTAVNAHDALVAALRGITKLYVALAESGDAGNWDPEQEPQVIAARLALSGVEKKG